MKTSIWPSSLEKMNFFLQSTWVIHAQISHNMVVCCCTQQILDQRKSLLPLLKVDNNFGTSIINQLASQTRAHSGPWNTHIIRASKENHIYLLLKDGLYQLKRNDGWYVRLTRAPPPFFLLPPTKNQIDLLEPPRWYASRQTCSWPKKPVHLLLSPLKEKKNTAHVVLEPRTMCSHPTHDSNVVSLDGLRLFAATIGTFPAPLICSLSAPSSSLSVR